MAAAAILKTAKSLYLSIGSKDRREIWHEDNFGSMNFTLLAHTQRWLFYVIKPQKYKNKNCLQSLF